MILTGIERLAGDAGLAHKWGRCGLVANQASIASDFRHALNICLDHPRLELRALFGPQHGFQATVQDNMIETSHMVHGPTGLPVYSLYSETREPTAEMLKGLDTLVIDLQIVGCRVYTFKYTIAACLRAAVKHGLKVVVLDRPNPLGGVRSEGRVLSMDATSFVGEFPIPMRHAMTPGEAARYFNQKIGAELEVVTMTGWDARCYWHELGLPWVLTSPNLPTVESVYAYPATVMLEGTNISEGRGTGLPFQFVGAPWIRDGAAFVKRVRELYGAGGGVYLRETAFEPTSQKYQGETCQGLQIHILEAAEIRTYPLGISLIRAAREQDEGAFAWKQPPYEYNFETLPFRLIMGDLRADQELEDAGFNPAAAHWSAGVDGWGGDVRACWLYDRPEG